MPWKRVRWTEAAQVAVLLDEEADLGEDARAAPSEYFAKLRESGQLNEATFFLSQALPRFETVAWAARTVRDLRETPLKPGPDADALKATLLWVQDPSDTRRRAAFEAANRVKGASAERLVALAAFFSGGSITPADVPPVQAPKEAAGRFSAGAVLLAAIATQDMTGALNKALDAGSVMADQGVGAA